MRLLLFKLATTPQPGVSSTLATSSLSRIVTRWSRKWYESAWWRSARACWNSRTTKSWKDHAHAQNGEHAGILHADHAAPPHYQRLRNLRHLENLVAVHDVAAVHRHSGRCRGLSTGGDDDSGCRDVALPGGVLHANMSRVKEAGSPEHDFHAIARKL